MDLTTIADDLKRHFESVVSTGEQFLSQHIPGVVEAAQKLAEFGEDPLVKIAIDDTVPPQFRAIAAKFLADLAAQFPPAAPAAPEQPEPEPEPAQQPVP